MDTSSLKKVLILTFVLLALFLLTGLDKSTIDGTANKTKFDNQNIIQCDDYQNFKNENWYSNLSGELNKKDKIDSGGAKLIQMLSSQSNSGSIDEIINKEGKIIEPDILKICKLNTGNIIIITQANFLNYLFSFEINSQKLSRVNGIMTITADENINLPEIKGDLITIKTTTKTTNYGDNNYVWEKVYHYNLKDNSVFLFETCKLETIGRNCEEIKKFNFSV